MRTNGKKATRLCPCGLSGDSSAACRCAPDRINAYRQKISGPLLDRIDMVVQVPRLSPAELLSRRDESLDVATLRQKVLQCRQRQLERNGKFNNHLQGRELDSYCGLDRHAARRMKMALEKLRLSARSYHRILKLSRTLADLEDCNQIGERHVSQALAFRGLDRNQSSLSD